MSDGASLFKVALFSGKFLLEIRDFRQLPQKGDYIHFASQECLGYVVMHVVYLAWNPDHWDVALVVGGGFNAPSKEMFYEAGWKIIRERKHEAHSKQQDKDSYENPSEAWQRRQTIYQRHENGETWEQIAEDLNLTVKRAKALESEWRRLRQRYLRQEESEQRTIEEMIDA